MNLFIRNPERPSWPMYLSELKKAMGVDTQDWPDSGVRRMFVQGIAVWVEPKDHGLREFKRGKLIRAMCECPRCGKVLAIGRLWQHAKIHVGETVELT